MSGTGMKVDEQFKCKDLDNYNQWGYIEELEKIKSEIQNLFTTSVCGETPYYNAIQVDKILNKHISELKGSD